MTDLACTSPAGTGDGQRSNRCLTRSPRTSHRSAGEHGVIVPPDGKPVDAARWVTTSVTSGCSIKQVQTALGHESAKITLDICAHLFPGDEDCVRDAIDRVVGWAAVRREPTNYTPSRQHLIDVVS